MKIFFRRIHLYLGLAAGLVILSCCLTGAILVFEQDLQMALHKKRYYVDVGAGKLSADRLVRNVQENFPAAKITGVKVYEDEERSAEVNISFPAEKENQKTEGQKASGRQTAYTVFVDPYTGQILEKYSYRETWFYKVFAFHRWLSGGQSSTGKLIVGISTLIFLFILITGMILWWPKTKRVLNQRLKIKWTAGWKRLNHDLHLVFGFYSAIFLFIFAFTGLAWSFRWFNDGMYKLTNSPLKNPTPPRSTYTIDAKQISFDDALSAAKKIYPAARFYNINLPKDSIDALTVTTLSRNAPHESATDAVYLDQYSGKILGRLEFADRSLGAQVRSTFKPIHTGSIWGMPSKILAFIVCLLGASFPVTGVILWTNRAKKKKNRQSVSIERDGYSVS